MKLKYDIITKKLTINQNKETSYVVIDAKDFLQTFCETLVEESVDFTTTIQHIIKAALSLLEKEYIIKPQNDQNKDMFELFLDINTQDIQNRPDLLHTVLANQKLQKSLQRTNFNKEEKRAICLSFFHDNNMISNIETLDQQQQQLKILIIMRILV